MFIINIYIDLDKKWECRQKYVKLKYGGKRLYHYNEDDFNFDLNYAVKQHGYTKT